MWRSQTRRDASKTQATLLTMPAIMQSILARVRAGNPITACYQDLLRLGVDLTQSTPEHAALHVLNPQTGVVTAMITLETHQAAEGAPLQGVAGRALQQHQTQVVPRLDRDPAFVLSMSDHQSQSAIAIPVIAGEAILGVLMFESPNRDWFVPTDKLWLEMLAEIAGTLIVIDAMRQQSEASGSEMTSPASTLKRQLSDLLDKEVLNHFPNVTGIMAEIFGVVPQSRQLLSLALRPETSIALHIRLREGEGTIGKVYQNGRPFAGRIDHAGGDVTHLLSTRSALVMPIFNANREIAGVLNLESSDPEKLSEFTLGKLQQSSVLPHIAQILTAMTSQYITNDMVIEQLLNDAEMQIFSIIDPQDIAGAYHQILQIAAQLTEERDVAAAILLVRDEQPQLISTTTGQDDEGWVVVTATLGEYAPTEQEWPLSQPSIARRAITSGTYQVVDNVGANTEAKSIGPRFANGSELCVPLVEGDKRIGAIDIYSPFANAFNARDGENLQRLAHYAVQAIRRTKDITHAQRADQQLHYVIDIQDVVTTLFSNDDLTEAQIFADRQHAFDLIAHRALKHTKADACTFFLSMPVRSPEWGKAKEYELVRQAHAGMTRPAEPERWRAGEGLIGNVFTLGNDRMEADISDLPREYQAAFAGVKSLLVLVLKRGNEKLGILTLESVQEHHFSYESIEWGKFFAMQGVALLTGVDLVTHIQRDRSMADLSDAIDVDISTMIQTDLATLFPLRRTLLQKVLDKTRELTGATRGAVYLSVNAYNRDSSISLEWGRLVEEGVSPPPASEALYHFGVDEGVSGRVFRTQDAVIYNSPVERPKDYFKRPGDTEALSGIAMPLFEGPWIVGVLLLESDVPDSFSEDNVEFAHTAATITSDIIVSAKTRLEEIQADLLREFEIDILRTQQPDISRFMTQVLDSARKLTNTHSGWGQVTLVRQTAVKDAPPELRVDQTYSARLPTNTSLDIVRDPEVPSLPNRHPLIAYVPFRDVILTQESWLSLDVQEEAAEREHLPWPEAHSLIVAPLIRPSEHPGQKGDTIGYIALSSSDTGLFDDSDDEVLSQFTQTIVIGLRNIALLNARKEQMREVTHIMSIALVPLMPRLANLTTSIRGIASGSNITEPLALTEQMNSVNKLITLLRDSIYWLRDLSDDDVQVEQDGPAYSVGQLVNTMQGSIGELARVLAGCQVHWSQPSEPTYIQGGKVRQSLMQAALFNYLENALKYGQQRDIEVIITRELEYAHFTVRSFGSQLDPSEYDLVFDLYYRGANVSPTTTGSGIGLFQTKRIAERLGGNVGYQPEGTDRNDFSFWLPLALAPTVQRERNA